MIRSLALLFLACLPASAQNAMRVPDAARQMAVTVADGWNTHRASLYQFARPNAKTGWQMVGQKPTPVLLGKNGMAWGRGLLPVPHGENGIPSKQERDGRAPAGCFKIGMLYGYAPTVPDGVRLPYYQVTARDCWIDDVQHPAYNRHVTVKLNDPPPWYEKQRMRLGDFAYEWLLEIRHNSDPPAAGAGSAIFFHIRRGQDSPTAGCTTMAKANLVNFLGWLQPEAQPFYVLLPRQEYNARIKSWGLPPIP